MTAPLLPFLLDVFDLEQIHELLAELAAIPAAMRARGDDYVSSGRVGPPLLTPDAVVAWVRGTHQYSARWEWSDGVWDGSCTCPVSYGCKHLFALGSAVLEPLRGSRMVPHNHERLLPARHVRWANLPTPVGSNKTGRRAAGAIEERSVSRSAQLSRSAPPDPVRMRANGLEQIRAGRFAHERSLGLALLLTRSPGEPTTESGSARIFKALECDDADLRCWQLAQELSDLNSGWLPAELESYRERADLAERDLASRRTEFARLLGTWADEHRAIPDRGLRFVLGMRKGQHGRTTIGIEARVTSSRQHDQPRSVGQLQQLLRDAQRASGLLDRQQMSMLEGYLASQTSWASMDWGQRAGFDTASLQSLLEAADGSSMLVWDPKLEPTLAEHHGLRAGEPVRVGLPGAIVVPNCVELEGHPAFELRLSWPSGESAPIARALLLTGSSDGFSRRPSLLLAEGVMYVLRVAPPTELLEQYLALGPVPIRDGSTRGLLGRLASGFPAMLHSLEPHTLTVHADAVFVLALADDDSLHVRLFAATQGAGWIPSTATEPQVWVLEYAGRQGWVEHTGAAEPIAHGLGDAVGEAPMEMAGGGAADSALTESVPSTQAPAASRPVWFRRMNTQALSDCTQWLVRAGARETTGDPQNPTVSARGFRIALAGAYLEQLAEALASRPTNARWYATPEARRLLMEPPVVRVKISAKSSGVDLLSISAVWEAEGMTLTEADFALLRRSQGALVRLSTGWVRRKADPELERMEHALADLGVEPGAEPQRVTLWQLAHADPASLNTLEALGPTADMLAVVARLRKAIANFKGIPSTGVPAGFVGELRTYQQQGLDFLAWTSSLELGAVLADDMGLGKTVQTLAWLLWLRQRSRRMGPALVVCPASVTHNWRREAARFAPGLRVAVLESGTERKTLLANTKQYDLLITNFALLRRDIEAWRETRLGAVVIDEAQNIKNPDAAITRAVLTLDSPCRLALTGTPIENRALDLWSIMQFVNPGFLGTRQQFAHVHDRVDAPAHRRRLLTARMRPVLLRRLKQDVAKDLPDRIEERLDCELHPAQRRLYLAQLAETREMVAELAAAPGGLKRHGIEILAALTRLRQICCHPALVGAPAKVGSGKFDSFWELLEPLLEEGRKVLVFSQFVRCLELLALEMKRRRIKHYMLTGATRRRDELVAEFQSDPDPCAFLISLKAGGAGLNLTAASDVVLFDPWWNPAVEAQAIDRTHRIGQHRTVTAYRLLTIGTLEERILELQHRKAALARDVLGEEAMGRSLTREDLDYLLEPNALP